MVRVLIVSLLLIALPATTLAGNRIEWDAGASSVLALLGEDGDGTRVALHRGHLTGFSPADAALFAVFLARADWNDLREHLGDHVSADRLADLTSEPIHLGQSGALTVFVDEARQRGSEVMVVVNGNGEVLGTRDLWEADRQLVLAYE